MNQKITNIFENIEAEIEVLGRIIRKPDLFYQVHEQLKAEDFQNKNNKAVFMAMAGCSQENKPIEIQILYEKLKGTDVKISDILSLGESVASTSDISHYVELVKEAGKKKRLQRSLKTALADLEKKTFAEISEKTIAELYDLHSDTTTTSTLVSIEEMMELTLAYLEEGVRTGGKSIGMKTGWKSLDVPLKGLNRGDLVIIGARPSIGKTVFALNLAHKVAQENKVLFFELEMKHYKMGMRYLAMKSGIPLNDMYSPHLLKSEEWSKTLKTVDYYSKVGNMTFDEKGRITLGYIRQQIHFLKETQGLDVVVVDHIGIMPKPREFNSKNDWMGEITASLKGMAKEFDVNIIALSQLNRDVEKRADRVPQLSDLRDSGNLEQDADVVLLLHREGYNNKTVADGPEPFEVIIAKNRDGMTGPVNMNINLRVQRVSETYWDGI